MRIRKRANIAAMFYAKRTVVDGVTFHSRGEANRYLELKLLQRAGKISELSLQPPFPMTVNGVHICTYIADFMYKIPGRIKKVVEDYKGGKITPEYRIKVKLFRALYGEEFYFVESGRPRKPFRKRRRKRST